MSEPTSSGTVGVSLDDLIALNDEIVALARAGVPLQIGLAELGRDLPGRLGRMARDVARRLDAGENLAQIFSDRRESIPRLYGALIEAGLRSGSLSVALEGLSVSARRIAELRRVVGLALLYPVIVFVVAYWLFWLTASRLGPTLLETYGEIGVAPGSMLKCLLALFENAQVWGAWLPLVVLAPVVLWWIQSGRALLVQPNWSAPLLGWLPSVGRLLRYGRFATFAEVLALLVQRHIPLPKALLLAAEACGDRQLCHTAQQLAERIERGETGEVHQQSSRTFPPLLGWLVASGRQHAGLRTALQYTADTYHRRALRQVDWLRIYLPILLTVGIGGAVTLLYALTVLAPWYALLNQIAEQ